MRFTLPAGTTRWAVRHARVPRGLLMTEVPSQPGSEDLADVNLVVAGGSLDAVLPADAPLSPELPFVDARGALVLPCFVDAHTHLDKGHISHRIPHPDGTFAGALTRVAADRAAHWSAEDVRDRMSFALSCAYAHGTAAIRTHLDSVGPQTRISWPVFAELRDLWQGRIDLQASPLFGIDLALDDRNFADAVAMVERFGTVLGAVTYPVPALQPGLDRIFRVAADRGWDLDFHADETGDPSVNTLATIAETALRYRFEGRILVGHCCSLAIMADGERERTIDTVARAGIAIVSLPLCNLYLQDRGQGDRSGHATPRWRGVTAVKELARAGVPVVIASDNTRDPFYAYGDLDMAEVWREGTRILHLDHAAGPWAESVSRTPAAILRRERLGVLEAGGPADFILFGARSLSEWMSRPMSDRTVVRGGRPIAAQVPAYARLDHLRGLKP